MKITAIFRNSPFENEKIIECDSIKLNTKKEGEIVILPNFIKTIFDIENTIIECKNTDKTINIKIDGTGIVHFDNKTNTFNCFGVFEEI